MSVTGAPRASARRDGAGCGSVVHRCRVFEPRPAGPLKLVEKLAKLPGKLRLRRVRPDLVFPVVVKNVASPVRDSGMQAASPCRHCNLRVRVTHLETIQIDGVAVKLAVGEEGRPLAMLEVNASQHVGL